MLSLQRSILTLALLASCAAMAPAKDGRDFAGYFSLTGASMDGDRVHVTLTLQIFNYSGADLQEAMVAIRSGPPEGITFGTYDAVREWRDGTEVRFNMHLTVSPAVYAGWGTRQPAISVVYRDPQGRNLERTVQASRQSSIDLAGHEATK